MWRPPIRPDADKILGEAVDDGRQGRPEIALAKFLWFHESATRYEPGLSAVRLSFALGYWMDLASRYKPALEAFVRVRDQTESAFRKDCTNFNLFQDIASLNGYLDERERTAKLFLDVASKDHEAAARLYHVAESHLISIGAYHECGAFLEPPKRTERAAESFRLMRQLESKWVGDETPPPPTARRHYINKMATLVALLALNHRTSEAREVYEDSLLVLDDDEFRTTMDAAMTGHLPPGR